MKREDIEKERVSENIIRELKKRYDIDTIEKLKEMNKKLKLNIGVFTKWCVVKKYILLSSGKNSGKSRKKAISRGIGT